jgi:SAM-dependent methyltransferase
MTALAALIAEPIIALGEPGSPFANIYAPESEIGQARVGVTAQFLENAGTYHTRYADTHYWSMLLDVALARTEAPAPHVVVDIGSGSGNSVIPLLKKFADAQVVASDISPNLLAILRDYFANDAATRERLHLLCADASQVRFTQGCADLVVGAAILHHIVEPETVIERAFTALKPGGWAVFFEPFRSGSSLLTLAYKQVLREVARRDKFAGVKRTLPPTLRGENSGIDVLKRIVFDYDTRVTMSAERAKDLDDKWMFQRAQFETIARAQGWAQCKCYSMQNGQAPVRTQTVAYLRLAAELEPDALPDWAWAILDEFDAQLSDDVRQSAWMEAMVLLQKPLTAQIAADTTAFNRWYWSPSLDRQGIFLSGDASYANLYWCGFDADGKAHAHRSALTFTAASSATGTIGNAKIDVHFADETLHIKTADAPSLSFQRFLVGAAPATAAMLGAFSNAAHILLVETRSGVLHAALIDSQTSRVRSGGLQRTEHGWAGTLVQYEGGGAPFAPAQPTAHATQETTHITVVALNANQLACTLNDAAHTVFERISA